MWSQPANHRSDQYTTLLYLPRKPPGLTPQCSGLRPVSFHLDGPGDAANTDHTHQLWRTPGFQGEVQGLEVLWLIKNL